MGRMWGSKLNVLNGLYVGVEIKCFTWLRLKLNVLNGSCVGVQINRLAALSNNNEKLPFQSPWSIFLLGVPNKSTWSNDFCSLVIKDLKMHTSKFIPCGPLCFYSSQPQPPGGYMDCFEKLCSKPSILLLFYKSWKTTYLMMWVI